MRAPRGSTFDPCPACKKEPKPFRGKDDVCADCKTVFEIGREAIERIKADPRVAYLTPWFLPGYHEAEVDTWKKAPTGATERFPHRALRNAVDWLEAIMAELPLAIGEVIGERGDYNRTQVTRGGTDFVFHIPRNARESANGARKTVLLTTDQRELLRDLDRAIRITLAETRANSLRAGADFLGSLATGRMTADAMDAKVAADVAHRRAQADKAADLKS